MSEDAAEVIVAELPEPEEPTLAPPPRQKPVVGKTRPTKPTKMQISKDALLGVKNYSQTRKMVQAILGIFGRVWHDNGKNVRIGLEIGDEKAVVGEGDSFSDAMNNTFVKAIEGKARIEKEIEELKAKEMEEARVAAEKLMTATPEELGEAARAAVEVKNENEKEEATIVEQETNASAAPSVDVAVGAE